MNWICTLEDMIARYGEDKLVHNDGKLAKEAIKKTIEDAQAIIKIYVPNLDQSNKETKEILKPICLDIALYRLSDYVTSDIDVRQRYEQAMETLAFIAKKADKGEALPSLTNKKEKTYSEIIYKRGTFS